MLMKTGREKQNSIRGSRGVCANGAGAIPVRCGTKRGISRMLSALLIACVTFFICAAGILIGRKAGTRLAGKAGILGGAILIFIGLEIFITSFF